ncbi:MAG: response regulator transcription factor [Synergistaceae bacterium]|jgi:DNA-binding response OmpR family regulator|nr:response regulator transcription factor [Synergistaceae bacterium]
MCDFAGTQGAKILIIEDDQEVLRNNKKHLEWEGYIVYAAETLNDAKKAVASFRPSLILLDVQMPDGSGYDFCEEIRLMTASPIIYLTCRDTSEDIIRGLAAGGDDYITKPFDLRVLSAKVYAGLRRIMDYNADRSRGAGIIEIPPMTINMLNGNVIVDGETIQLAQKELQLLAYLATHAGREVSSRHLLEAVWGDTSDISTGTVKKHIYSLKKKMNFTDESAFRIRSTRNKGYVFSKLMDKPEW